MFKSIDFCCKGLHLLCKGADRASFITCKEKDEGSKSVEESAWMSWILVWIVDLILHPCLTVDLILVPSCALRPRTRSPSEASELVKAGDRRSSPSVWDIWSAMLCPSCRSAGEKPILLY